MSEPTQLKSVKKAMVILFYLADSNEPRSFTDVSKAFNMGKATTNRFLSSLEALGMIRRNPETAKYRLGLATLRLGIAASNQIELRRDLRPYLTELMNRTGETSNLVVLDGTRPVFIDNVESPQNLRMYSRIGRHTHPYCTAVGKVLLANQSEEFLQHVFEHEPFEPRTINSITSKEAFLTELEKVRKQGYAVDNEEGELGACCIGAPICDSSGHVIAAISISGPSSRVTPDKFDQLGAVVREVALHTQQQLGRYTPDFQASDQGSQATLSKPASDHTRAVKATD